jgi:hypothetical protein
MNLVASSMKVRKYFDFPPVATLIGPHKSEWTSSNGSFALVAELGKEAFAVEHTSRGHLVEDVDTRIVVE